MNREDTLRLARKHSIRREVASPDFFEGALMGNGSLGVVACTRPDALVLRLGHNDIRDKASTRATGTPSAPLRRSGTGSFAPRGTCTGRNGTGNT